MFSESRFAKMLPIFIWQKYFYSEEDSLNESKLE